MQHLLKNSEGQEDMILQLLVDLSSECGVTFPTSASGGYFQFASQTSLHAIDDDLSVDLQTVWDDVRLHLRRHLVAKLQATSHTSNSQSGIRIKSKCLQYLFFLFPESDVLVKYQNIQHHFVVELLQSYRGRSTENILGAYENAVPKLYAMIKEDMFVLSHVIDSSLIITFINETFFEAITEEMKTFFEILCETGTEEQALQPPRLNKKKHKQRVHALAVNIEDHQRKTRDTTLQLKHLKLLCRFIKLFLWLEDEVEKSSSEILFLSCHPELKGHISGILKTDIGEDNINESCQLDKSSLLIKEMPTMKFGWRKNLKDMALTLVHDLPSVLEEVTARVLQSDAEELSANAGCNMTLVNIPKSYEHYGTIAEQLRPMKVVKFCFDITEEFDLLFPVVVACRGDSLQKVKICFIEAFSKSVMSILSRLQEWSIQVPDKAPIKTVLVCMSSALHVLHHLTHYNEQLSKKPLFIAAVQRYQEFISDLQIQVTNYCVNVCATSLLHDAESHHWDDNNAFYEGERCSFSIQMWHYFCCGLRHDLWTVVSPVSAQKILSEVLEQTLALLTFRYCQAHPSYKRASQIRIDVLAILSCVENVMWSVCSTVPELKPTQSYRDVVFKIHSYCDRLLMVLTISTAPLEILSQAVKNSFDEHHAHPSEPVPEDLLYWLKKVNPSIFPSSSQTPSAEEMAVQGQLKLLLSQPCCNWNLLLETLLHPDCLVARTLLTGSIREAACLESTNLEIITMEANNGKNLPEAILTVFSYCTFAPCSFTILLEKYMDQEQLWDSLCNQTGHTSTNVVIKFLRRVLLKSVRGMVKEVVSLITSMESSDHSLSGSHHRNVTDILLRALPEKWSFRNLDRKEAKHKDFTRLTAEAVSIVINKLPSVIACLLLPIKYFYSFSERKISEQYPAVKNIGILVWNLFEIICHVLKDGNATEQLTDTTLSRWSHERLALVCVCLEKIAEFKATNSKDDIQRVLEDLQKRKPDWIENQLLKAKTLSCKGDFAMQEDSSTEEVQGNRLNLTEQKINMMVLDICHKPGGSEYLRQIHHIIQLNEVYLNEALSSQHSEQAEAHSEAFHMTLTSAEDQISSFNPLHTFTLPGISAESESSTMKEGWNWSALLPHCLQANPVTLGGLLLHRWESKDKGSLTEEEKDVLKDLKDLILNRKKSLVYHQALSIMKTSDQSRAFTSRGYLAKEKRNLRIKQAYYVRNTCLLLGSEILPSYYLHTHSFSRIFPTNNTTEVWSDLPLDPDGLYL
ncbi:uncharacterized protein KIAA0825 homolog isoform X3 [Aquarana catesbeiana]|uniref:uncharacterized protein KIAA0825 homolog isoform X3 n=1 Tax=Aquarana catesbeiana TaxID=8400 RepID=UPI003CCA56C8